MVPGNNVSRVMRTVPGQSTGDDDDILVDNRGQHWKRLDPHETDSTTGPGVRGCLTSDGRIVY
jgi:hypothetical protein